jgi:DNA-binding transcriptional LysR family regulator
MNLRFVEAFVWVARLRSFKGAAEKLFTTQAAISNRIATLESEIDVRLFERDKRSVELTRHGRTLMPIAEQMLVLAQQFRSAARPNGKADITGTLRIGVIDSVAHTWLPELVSAFSAQYPNATTELYSDITPTLRDELLRGRIDCALMSEELFEANIESRVLVHYPVVWVGAISSAEAVVEGNAVERLTKLPIFTFHRQSSVYKNIGRLLPREPRPRIHTFSSMSSMIGMVKAGLGVAALPLPVVMDEIDRGVLHVVDGLPDLDSLPISVNIRSEHHSPILEDFLAMAVAVCESWSRRRPDCLRMAPGRAD